MMKYPWLYYRFLALRRMFRTLWMHRHQSRLAKLKSEQRRIYETIRGGFGDLYREQAEPDIRPFITPFWAHFNQQLEKTLLPYPSFSFLKDPIIMYSMFVTAGGNWLIEEKKYLESCYPRERLKELLVEDHIGDPILFDAGYLTSHNSIHHLYHLVRWSRHTGTTLEYPRRVVEWGGGYGNMAKLYRRLVPDATYLIIDTPIFTCLQWLYLKTALGDDAVHLMRGRDSVIQAGRVNLLSLGSLEHAGINGDLFISTWALSESSRHSQEYVIRHQWFGARHLLLGYQESNQCLPDAGTVGRVAADHGAKNEEIRFLSGQHYAFR